MSPTMISLSEHWNSLTEVSDGGATGKAMYASCGFTIVFCPMPRLRRFTNTSLNRRLPLTDGLMVTNLPVCHEDRWVQSFPTILRGQTRVSVKLMRLSCFPYRGASLPRRDDCLLGL